MANSKNTDIKNYDKRNISLKWFSIGSVVLLVAIVLLFNILFDSILGKYFVFDLSSTGQNTISEVTEDYINSLPADTQLRIVGLFDEPSNIKDTPYEYIVPLLENYAAKSGGRITVDYINPETYPSIIRELDPQGMFDLSKGTYAVAYNNRVITVNPYDCFTYDQNYLNQYNYMLPTANITENTFTNAIVNLTRGFQHKAYFVAGLGEPSHVQFSNILSALGCESVDLPATEDYVVPSDCDLLIVNGINVDITERMAQAILDYLNNGGNMFVAVNFSGNNSTESFEHLNLVMHEMNLNIDPYLLLENDPAYQLGNDANTQRINSQVEVLQGFSQYSNESTLRSSYARPIRSYDNPYSYIQVSPVLQTSQRATANQVDASGHASQFANEGLYYVGYYSTFDGMANPPEVYLFGTMNFTSDEYISEYSFNDPNIVFMRNLVRSLVKAENTVVVDAKPLEDYSIAAEKVNKNSVNTIMVVLMIIIPAALVISGVIIYSKRKNL